MIFSLLVNNTRLNIWKTQLILENPENANMLNKIGNERVKTVQPSLNDNKAGPGQASSKLDQNQAISAAAHSTAHSSESHLTASEELLLIQTQHALQSTRMTAARKRQDSARALDRDEHKTIARTLNRMIGIISALLNAFLFLIAIAEMFYCRTKQSAKLFS